LREGDVVKPVLQALLVADHVYSDATTGKKIVAGIFHRLLFKRMPPPEEQGEQGKSVIQVGSSGHRAGSPFCYVSLTEVRGEQHFDLRYVDLGDDNVVFGTRFGFKSDNPLQTIETILPLPNLPAAKPGVFALELLWNNEPLGSHRIIVDEIADERKPDGNGPR
jgi:hypothetical protein